MKKHKFELEYQLNSASPHVLWSAIGTPLGLAEWFADGVTVKGDQYTFIWDESEQTAKLIDIKLNSSIRFCWEEDLNTEYYFELKQMSNTLTGNLTLILTDFAENNDMEDLKRLWNKQIEVLRRKLGI